MLRPTQGNPHHRTPVVVWSVVTWVIGDYLIPWLTGSLPRRCRPGKCFLVVLRGEAHQEFGCWLRVSYYVMFCRRHCNSIFVR